MRSYSLKVNLCRNVEKMEVLSQLSVINETQRIIVGVSMKMELRYPIRRLILGSQIAPDVSMT